MTEVRQRLKLEKLSETKLLTFLREKTDPLIIEQITNALIKELTLEKTMATIAESIYPCTQDILSAFNSDHQIASHGHNHYKRETIPESIFHQELKQSNQFSAT